MELDQQQPRRRVISVFTLVMINVIAIDSLRNVPAAAEYGFSLLFLYALAAIGFFIPSALVSAELASSWPKTGGIYVWVREAFGRHWGFFAIWLQWIENVIWYPTMMSFIAATILYVFDPNLVHNKIMLLLLMISFFWLATFLNMLGMKISGFISILTAIFGTLLPMTFIILLGSLWLYWDKPIFIHFDWQHFFPGLNDVKQLSYLAGILLSLVGMELSASHAQDVKTPQRDYPKAMLISVLLIVSSLTLSSLAIAVVIPKEQIALIDGLVQAFSVFFNAYHMPWMTYIIAILIVVGGFGGISAWIIGPSKGLLAAADDDNLPKLFAKVNDKGAPIPLLWLQAVIFTGLCSLFLFMPSVNSSYWVLTALTTQLYMVMYILMFMAVIRLRYSHPETKRGYEIPGGKLGIWLVGLIGIITCLITIIVGFLPPEGFAYGTIERYETILISGFIILSMPPFIVGYLKKV